MTEDGRICTKCSQFKEWENFSINKSNGLNGRKSVCKPCTNKAERARNRRYRQCPKKSEELRQKFFEKNLKVSYNLTLSDYEQILEDQNNSCAVCGLSNDEYFKKHNQQLCVDHCHKTGKVRGLLCRVCNSGLGKLGDTSDGVYKGYTYLKNFEESIDE